MFVNVLLSGEACHWKPLPVCPETETVVTLPWNTADGEADTVPATGGALTVTVAAPEMACGQTPLCTTARKLVVAVRLLVNEVNPAVPAMSLVVLVKLSSERCHF